MDNYISNNHNKTTFMNLNSSTPDIRIWSKVPIKQDRHIKYISGEFLETLNKIKNTYLKPIYRAMVIRRW